jgi:ABC-2 type transport system permease protein
MTATMTTPALPAGRTIRLGLSRIRYEVRGYFRQGDTVFFTFLFPLVFLTIFSVAFSKVNFGKDAGGHAMTAADYYLPAMLGAALLLRGLHTLEIDMAG